MQIDLASVEDFYENNLLTSLFYEEFGLSGENPINKNYAAWIGLTMSLKEDSSGQKYVKTRWVDGFPAAYTEWAKAEPDMNSIRHDPEFSCAYIGKKNFKKRFFYVFKTTRENGILATNATTSFHSFARQMSVELSRQTGLMATREEICLTARSLEKV